MSVALLFTPQGSQTVGMGRELAEASRAAAEVFRMADDVLGWPVSATCWEGPEERLNDTRQTQPCVMTTSLACHAALVEAAGDLRPTFVAGHSVGEYAALVVAGVLEPADALRLVARRAALMAAQDDTGAMAAVVGLDREVVAGVVEVVARPTELVVANDNAPGQVVISGDRAAIERAEETLIAAGARRVITLPVSGAFHSPRMGPVAEQLARSFDEVGWRDARVAVVSNVTGEPLTDAATIRSLLAEQVRSPVEWVAGVRRMVTHGVDLFIECGPGSALAGMVRRIAPEARAANVSDRRTLAKALDQLHVPASAPV